VIQAFLTSGLVDEITIGSAPVLIGNGIPLFGEPPGNIGLRLRAAHTLEGGMTHATYDVVRAL
jgi:riboflavin biosynthesis pyrimidine reductase